MYGLKNSKILKEINNKDNKILFYTNIDVLGVY